jgi:Zn finger protein HypA/HybF involved in hydrogenase expression
VLKGNEGPAKMGVSVKSAESHLWCRSCDWQGPYLFEGLLGSLPRTEHNHACRVCHGPAVKVYRWALCETAKPGVLRQAGLVQLSLGF